MYGVISSITKKIKKVYGSISSTTRSIKKVYGVVGGVTRLIYSSGLGPICGVSLWLYNSYNNRVFYCFSTPNGIMNTAYSTILSTSMITGISGDGKTVVRVNHNNWSGAQGAQIYRYNSSTGKMDLSFETTDTFSSTFVSNMGGTKQLFVNYDGTKFMLCGRYSNASCIYCVKYNINESSISSTGIGIKPLNPLSAGLPGFESGEYSLYDNFTLFVSDDLSQIACGSYFNADGSYIYCGGYDVNGMSNNYYTYSNGNFGPYVTPDGKYLILGNSTSSYSSTVSVYYITESSCTKVGAFTISSTNSGYTYNKELEVLSFYYTTGNMTSYKLSSSSVTQIGTLSTGYSDLVVRGQSFSGTNMIITASDSSQSRRIRHCITSLGENGNIAGLTAKAIYTAVFGKADSPNKYNTGSAYFIHE